MDFNYLTLIDNIKGLNYPTLWRFLLLGFFRIAPIVSLAPFLGAKVMPNSARVALAIALTVVFLPSILFHTETTYMTDPAFVGYAFKELFLGLVMGFVISVPFFIAQSAGIFIDYMRGSSMLMAQDPTLQIQASSIGIIFNYYMIVLFYTIDGPLAFFGALESSFAVFPVDRFVNPIFFQFDTPFWQSMLHLVGRIFSLSLELAAPALLACLMAEMFLGIANRLAPQVQIAFLGMSLKSLLGLTLLWAGWYVLLQQMSTISLDWLAELNQILSFPI